MRIVGPTWVFGAAFLVGGLCLGNTRACVSLVLHFGFLRVSSFRSLKINVCSSLNNGVTSVMVVRRDVIRHESIRYDIVQVGL